MAPDSPNRNINPLDAGALDRLAIAYVGRYATTRAKLAAYLRRKLKARGWDGEGEPPIDAVVARCARLGYVDDRAFAAMRGAALLRKGYGPKRIEAALWAAGIDEADRIDARTCIASETEAAAVAFARRRKLGPFFNGIFDEATRRRHFAAMLRAGHAPAIARRVLDRDGPE